MNIVNKDIDIKAERWLDSHREEILSEWMELCRIPSVVSAPDGDAPFGIEAKRALHKAEELFEKYGFPSRNGNNYYMVSTYGEGDKSIGLFGHCDVVAGGDNWTYTKPFEPVIIDDTLIGRGAEDNKAGVMASLLCMRMIRELSLPIKSQLRAVVGSAEEVGMEDMEAYTKNEPLPDFSIIPDAEFPLCVGERGIYRVFARSNKPLCAIKHLRGGESVNAVTDKTEARIVYSDELWGELSCLHTRLDGAVADRIKISRNENEIIIVTSGISTHASTPEHSVNATYILTALLKDAQYLPPCDRELMEKVNFMIADTNGKNLGLHFVDSVFGELTVANGRIYLDDGHICLSFDSRYGSERDAEYMKNGFEKAISAQDFTPFDAENMNPIYMDKNGKIPTGLTKIYNEIAGGEYRDAFCIGGKTYASSLKNAVSVGTWIPYYPDGTPRGINMENGHGGPHSPDEMISISGFFAAVRVILQYILYVDGAINE